MRWPHYEHIFFDCDSTLSTIEGIDILAETAGKRWRVEVLTNAAMDGKLDLEDVYAKRLQAVRPTRAQIHKIRSSYKQNIVEDAQQVIAALHHLGHKVYIISGGLEEPVAEFGVYLGVPRARIRAVAVNYNQLSGQWWMSYRDDVDDNDSERYLDFEESALTVSDGKAEIVRELRGEQNGRSLLIGDGSSDLFAGKAVDLFVGFGGVVSREKVRAQAPVFLTSASMAPLLPLAAGPSACRTLRGTAHETLFRKANQLIQTGALTFNNERLKQKFHAANAAAH